MEPIPETNSKLGNAVHVKIKTFRTATTNHIPEFGL